MNILALDLSKTCTGWAIWQEGWEKPRYGHWVLGSEETLNGQVYEKLAEYLQEQHSVMNFQYVYAEKKINPDYLRGHTNIDTLTILCGIAEHLKYFCRVYRSTGSFPGGIRRLHEINVSSWRSDFIGKQKRGTKKATLKALTMERCRQLGFRPRKEDEADALGLLTYAILSNGITPPWLADEVLRPPLGRASA